MPDAPKTDKIQDAEDDGQAGGIEYVPVENAIAAKVRAMADVSPRALYTRAAATREAADDELQASVREQVAALSNQFDAVAARPGANGDELRALAERAFELKGLAGSVGYPLISQIGEALYRLARRLGTADGATLDVIGDLVSGIELVLERRMRGEGGAEGRALIAELSTGLRQVIDARRG